MGFSRILQDLKITSFQYWQKNLSEHCRLREVLWTGKWRHLGLMESSGPGPLTWESWLVPGSGSQRCLGAAGTQVLRRLKAQAQSRRSPPAQADWGPPLPHVVQQQGPKTLGHACFAPDGGQERRWLGFKGPWISQWVGGKRGNPRTGEPGRWSLSFARTSPDRRQSLGAPHVRKSVHGGGLVMAEARRGGRGAGAR